MAAITLPSRWRQQPQVPLGIDWRNPITLGLADAGYGRYSAVTRSWGTPQNANATFEGTRVGMAVSQTLGATRGTTFTRSRKYTDNNTQSVFVRADIRALPASSLNTLIAVAWRTAHTSPFAVIQFRNSAAGGLVGQYMTCDTANLFTANSGASFYSTTAGPIDYGLRRAGTNVDFMREGVLHSSGTLSTDVTSAFSGATGPLELNSLPGNESADALISVWAIWCRTLSLAEYASIAANPYQLFAPLVRRIYVSLPAGAPTEIELMASRQLWVFP